MPQTLSASEGVFAPNSTLQWNTCPAPEVVPALSFLASAAAKSRVFAIWQQHNTENYTT